MVEPTELAGLPPSRGFGGRPPPRRPSGPWRYRPPGYGTAAVWLASGLFRDRRSLLAALAAAWLNLPLAIFGAGVGLVVGGVGGASGGHLSALSDRGYLPSVGDLALFQVGGVVGTVVGGLVGLVVGFVAGLVGPWRTLLDQPAYGLVALLAQAVGALVIGLVYVAASVASEGWVLRLQGARRMSRREAALLMPIVEDCAGRLGVVAPVVLVDDSNQVGAAAGARHIVINQGLLDEFGYDRAVIAGVVSHELVHWRNADAVARALVRGVLLPLYVLYLAIAAVRSRLRNPVASFLVLLLAWPIDVTVRRIVMPVQALDGRAAEYMADQGAVLTGNREGLRRVLSWLHGSLDGGRNGWEQTLCASHPPNELRLERLEDSRLAYGLPDEQAPPRSLRVEVTRTWREIR